MNAPSLAKNGVSRTTGQSSSLRGAEVFAFETVSDEAIQLSSLKLDEFAQLTSATSGRQLARNDELVMTNLQ